MNTPSRWVLAVSMLLCGAALAHVGCGKSAPAPEPAAASASAAEPAAGPPDIEKGVKIDFRLVGDNGKNGAVPVVEVRGKWVKIQEPNGKTYWYNADNFGWYEVIK